MTAFIFLIGEKVDLGKPRVFIASSVEGLPIAEAINANLDHVTFPTLWKDGTFHLGSHSLDDLVKKSAQVDFAIFVFTPDDVVSIREKQAATVRDNVLFELGLFIGAIGKDRCYIVRPRNADMHLPSDLLGITVADYATDRGDGDWFSALNAACTKIKAEITERGILRKGSGATADGAATPSANPIVYKVTPFDLKVLGAAVQSSIAVPGGSHVNYITRDFQPSTETMTAFSIMKLLKLGFIERSIDSDMEGDPVYLYSVTEEGIDFFLANESAYMPPSPPPPPPRPAPPPPPKVPA